MAAKINGKMLNRVIERIWEIDIPPSAFCDKHFRKGVELLARGKVILWVKHYKTKKRSGTEIKIIAK